MAFPELLQDAGLDGAAGFLHGPNQIDDVGLYDVKRIVTAVCNRNLGAFSSFTCKKTQSFSVEFTFLNTRIFTSTLA